MRLTTLGTGTAAPSPTRVQSGQLVEHGDVQLLIDCGSGVVHRMAEFGVNWVGLTHIALSHFHADHMSDLATLFIAWRYGTLPPRTAPISLIGPPGTILRLEALERAFGHTFGALGYPLEILELPAGARAPLGAGVSLEARKVPHTHESVAYSVEAGGRRMVYTGDTGFDESLGDWASGSDLLLCECSLPESLAMPTHLTPRQCGALAAAAAPTLLALTHFYPPVEREDIRGAVAEHFAGGVVLATDRWSIEI